MIDLKLHRGQRGDGQAIVFNMLHYDMVLKLIKDRLHLSQRFHIAKMSWLSNMIAVYRTSKQG